MRELRRGIDILDAEISAICREAGVPEGERARLLRRIEGDREPVPGLSCPVREALSDLLALRRRMAQEQDASP